MNRHKRRRCFDVLDDDDDDDDDDGEDLARELGGGAVNTGGSDGETT